MTSWVQRLDRAFYPDAESNWDDHLFRETILERISPATVVLDVGAGAGIVEHMNFRGRAARVCGVDLDPRVAQNPFLDEGIVTNGETLPYPDNTFDVVFSDNVLEHLENPDAVFGEIARVLKPGGSFCFKTPNKSHYMPLIARVTPHRFHAFVNRLRGRAEVDTFPTRYRANSRKAIHRLAGEAGLDLHSLAFIEGRPEYTRMFWLLYLLGIAYERLVNSTRLFSRFRILLIGVLTKPS